MAIVMAIVTLLGCGGSAEPVDPLVSRGGVVYAVHVYWVD